MKFETEKDLVDYIDMCHLQNTNGRETHDEMFRLGIEAAIQEMIEFKLLTIPFVSLGERSEPTVCEHRWQKYNNVSNINYCSKCWIIEH